MFRWKLEALVAVVMLAVAPSLALAWEAQAIEDPGEILRNAARFHQAGSYEDAIREYQRFLGIHPNVADIRSNLGAAYAAAGRLGDAIDQYRRALELGNGRNPTAIRLNLGLAYYKTLQLDLAAVEFTKVLEAEPGNLQASLLLADCYMRQEDYESVIRILEPIEGLHQEDNALAYLLGTALIREGQVEKGQLLVDRILRKGDSAEAHMMLGTAYMMAKEIPKAMEEFQAAVRLNPNLPSANSFLAKTLREMGRVDEANPYFLKELEVNPLDFESHLYVGVYRYKRDQDYEGALRHFEQALQIRPNALEVRFQIGLVYVLTDRTAEALELIEGVVAEAPDFLEGHVTLTRLYYRMNRREDAQKHREIVERLRAEKDSETLKEMVPDSSGSD